MPKNFALLHLLASDIAAARAADAVPPPLPPAAPVLLAAPVVVLIAPTPTPTLTLTPVAAASSVGGGGAALANLWGATVGALGQFIPTSTPATAPVPAPATPGPSPASPPDTSTIVAGDAGGGGGLLSSFGDIGGKATGWTIDALGGAAGHVTGIFKRPSISASETEAEAARIALHVMGTNLYDACSSGDNVDVLRPLIDETRENAAALNCEKY